MHLSKLPSGHWRVAVKYKGQRKTATATTRTEARLIGHELELELGAKRRPADMTVGDLLDMHLLAVKDVWSPTTRHDAIAVADRLPAVFRQRLVAEVDAGVIAALYRELTRNNWSPHRLRRVRLVISTAWAMAIDHRLALHNPTRDAKPPRLPHRAITPPDQATVEQILAHTSGQFEVFLRLAAATGARRGELVALRWTDLELDKHPKGSVHITRALVCTIDGIEERDTKTAVKGHRTIKLGDSLTKRLREHRGIQLEKAIAAGLVERVGFEPTDGVGIHVRDTPDAVLSAVTDNPLRHHPNPADDTRWVFSHDAGVTPFRPDYASREFRRTCIKADVTGVRLHDIRHHLLTSMLADGDTAQAVATRAGHASTSTTLRVYSHWLEEDDTVADRMDDRYG